MAGTINLALSQQLDADARPLSGGLLYFYAAGTTTPQSAYQNEALTILHSNPIVLDASGRVPMFYLADGNIKIRLTDENGVTVIAADNLLVIGPSTTGGGSSNVDPATVLQTGDVKIRFGEGTLTGYVRMNGRTIGKTGSGASELADTTIAQALFEYLWQFPVIVLNTAKGLTAHDDFLAGRLLTLPDLRGRIIAGMDDMGNVAAGYLTQAFWGVNPTILGNYAGGEFITLNTARMPAHTHTQQGSHSGSGTADASTAEQSNFPLNSQDEISKHTHHYGLSSFATSGISLQHSHLIPTLNVTTVSGLQTGGGAVAVSAVSYTGGTPTGPATALEPTDHTHNVAFEGVTDLELQDHAHRQNSVSSTVAATSVSVSTTISGQTGSTGSGTSFGIVQPTMVLTMYIKL